MVELRVIHALAARAPSLVRNGKLPEDVQAFLAGSDGGEGVLHALFDHVLDETVPPRLLETVFHHRAAHGRRSTPDLAPGERPG